MSSVVIYTLDGCFYCERAMRLLQDRQVEFRQIDVTDDPSVRREVVARTSHRTFPQIFLGDRFVGGCDELVALDRSGGLDPYGK